MKHIFILLLLTGLVGCLPPMDLDNMEEPQSAEDSSNTEVLGGRYMNLEGSYSPVRDFSNTIQTTIYWYASWETGSDIVQVNIPADEVLVGGGAQVHQGYLGGKAFLTASFPVFSGTRGVGWQARSSNYTNPGALNWTYVYAIGMKLYHPWDWATPLPVDQVQPYVKYTMAYGGETNHPTATAMAPAGYEVISGGACVWDDSDNPVPNNYLTTSYPYFKENGMYGLWGYGWTASSKDHCIAYPASITAYAISIPHNGGTDTSLPYYGDIRINYRYGDSSIWERSTQTSPSAPGSVSAGSSVTGSMGASGDGGWCTTGVGGKTTFSGWGRMLTGLVPYETSTMVTDYDDRVPDSGTLYNLIIGIQYDDASNY